MNIICIKFVKLYKKSLLISISYSFFFKGAIIYLKIMHFIADPLV